VDRSLPPGASKVYTTNLSHVWFARDLRVDDFKHPDEREEAFSDETNLIAFHILDGASQQTLRIPHRKCIDLGTDCAHWVAYGECERNDHMETLCPYSCGYCEGDEVDQSAPAHDEL
jgi:hypothetical protein